MSAMHQDSSSDLKVVGTKLKDTLGVIFNLYVVCLLFQFSYQLFVLV